MLNPRQVPNHNYHRNSLPIRSQKNSRGFVLLVMLSLIIALFTVMAISRLSVNTNQLKQRSATLKAMTKTRDSIMAFALSQQTPQTPPGTLPCPDTDGDGLVNRSLVTGICTNRLGLVPFRSLGIEEPLDSAGAPLWYAIEINYGRVYDPTTVTPPFNPLPPFRNSSLPSALTLLFRASNISEPMAFVVIAPGLPIGAQARTLSPPSAAAFLEGANASGGTAFDDLQDDTHNDRLLGMPLGLFWTNVERLVLSELRDKIIAYQGSPCASYPSAVPYNNNDDNSQAGLLEGRVPLGPAVSCALSTPGSLDWVNTHWTRMFYYVACPPATPLCLQLQNGTAPITRATAILIGPGITLPSIGQVRLPTPPLVAPTITNFFEGQNNSAGDNIFDNITPLSYTGPSAINDVITIIAP